MKCRSVLGSCWLATFFVFGQSALADQKVCVDAKNDPVCASLDLEANPCVDFYQYACGSWLKNNPLPADRALYGRFTEVSDKNFQVLKQTLEDAAKERKDRTPNQQKIGDLYASCMDEAQANEIGLSPIRPALKRVEDLKNKAQLGSLVTKLHAETYPGLFNFGSGQDLKDSTKVIAQFDQGGLGLHAKEYYFDTDAKTTAIREKYVAHIEKTLVLSGVAKKKAATMAKAIMAFETSLAGYSLRQVDRRDPKITYHIMTVAELQKMVPFVSWSDYLAAIDSPPVQSLNVGVIDFAKGLQEMVNKTSLRDLKAYLGWNILRDASPFLSQKFVEENFDFYGRTLAGQKEMRPRWFRCTHLVDALLGDALGQVYVEKAFSPESKTRMLNLIANLEKALATDINGLDWMAKETKEQAHVKLAAIAKKIGYPDKWRDYSKVKIGRGDLIGAITNASVFELHREMGKIGKPVDKTEWGMTPPTVNAYYEPSNNDINFPAGILQPPFFYALGDDALNYGAIGVVIGHEMTHGFDDQGRQFDAQGNLRDWWTPADSKAFTDKAQCFVDQYGSYVVVDQVKEDGKLTLGENLADNGGIRLSWNALMNYANEKKAPDLSGLTPEQRFFLGFAQVWCANQTEASSLQQVKTDPHSLGNVRANFAVQNMPEFQKAFSCKAGQPMAPVKRCRVW